MTSLDYEKARRRRAARVGGASFTNDVARRVIYLNVPFEAKGTAKALGARWDAQAGMWFCLAGTTAASALLARFGVTRARQRQEPRPPSQRPVAMTAGFVPSPGEWLPASTREAPVFGAASPKPDLASDMR